MYVVLIFIMSDSSAREWSPLRSRMAAQNNLKPLERLCQLCRQQRRFLFHIRANLARIVLTEAEADTVAMKIVALSRDMPRVAISAAQTHNSPGVAMAIPEEVEDDDEEPMSPVHTIVVHCALYIGDIVRALPSALADCDETERIIEVTSLLQSIHAELLEFGIEAPASSAASSPSTSLESCA